MRVYVYQGQLLVHYVDARFSMYRAMITLTFPLSHLHSVELTDTLLIYITNIHLIVSLRRYEE